MDDEREISTDIAIGLGKKAVEAGSNVDEPRARAVDTIANVLHWYKTQDPHFSVHALIRDATVHYDYEITL